MLPFAPESSMRRTFFRPAATRVASRVTSRATVETGQGHAGVVHRDLAARARPTGPGNGPLAGEGLQRSHHFHYLLSGQETQKVNHMGAQVAEGARAGQVAVEAPAVGRLGVNQPVLQVSGPDLAERTDAALGHQPAGQGQGRDPPVIETNHAKVAICHRGGGRLGQRTGLGHGVGQRFFAQDVLARPQGSQGDLGVAGPRGANVDQVDVVSLDHLAPGGRRGLKTEQSGVPGQPRPRPGRIARSSAAQGGTPRAWPPGTRRSCAPSP